jgi:hypothetical protein
MLITYKSRRNSQWKTHSFVAEYLPTCLSDLILDFLLPIHVDSDYEITASGFYELVPRIIDINSAMIGAAGIGDIDLVKKMIDRGANAWNRGIAEACRWQQVDIGEFLIVSGWNPRSIFNGGILCSCHPFNCKTFGEYIHQIRIHFAWLSLFDGIGSMIYTN